MGKKTKTKFTPFNVDINFTQSSSSPSTLTESSQRGSSNRSRGIPSNSTVKRGSWQSSQSVSQTPHTISQTPQSISQTPESIFQTPESISQTPESLSQTVQGLSQRPQNISQAPQNISQAPQNISQAPQNITKAPPNISQGPQRNDQPTQNYSTHKRDCRPSETCLPPESKQPEWRSESIECWSQSATDNFNEPDDPREDTFQSSTIQEGFKDVRSSRKNSYEYRKFDDDRMYDNKKYNPEKKVYRGNYKSRYCCIYIFIGII